MYNRYIPQPDGSYRRSRVGEPERPAPPPPKPQPAPEPVPPCPAPCPPERPKPPKKRPQNCPKEQGLDGFLKKLLPGDFDTGDLLVIVLLLLMAGDSEESRGNALLTIAMYFLM